MTSFLSDLVKTLLGNGNPVETEGDPYSGNYKQVFDVAGEDVEVEYFDDRPQQMKWKNWRTNQDGETF